MATLEKIRSKGVFLLIVVGLAMFAFIIGDFLSSSKTFFGEQKQKVGVIDGETIKYTDFMEQITHLADCDDTKVMLNALHSPLSAFDIGAAGTSMRFLTAYLSNMSENNRIKPLF